MMIGGKEMTYDEAIEIIWKLRGKQRDEALIELLYISAQCLIDNGYQEWGYSMQQEAEKIEETGIAAFRIDRGKIDEDGGTALDIVRREANEHQNSTRNLLNRDICVLVERITVAVLFDGCSIVKPAYTLAEDFGKEDDIVSLTKMFIAVPLRRGGSGAFF